MVRQFAFSSGVLTDAVAVGTVVSIYRNHDLTLTEPIMNRLRQATTGLRTSPDASLLVESLLDLGKKRHSSFAFVTLNHLP